MWWVVNIITIAVAVLPVAVGVGILLQKVAQLQKESALAAVQLADLKEAVSEWRTRQGRRLGRIEGWITGTEAIREGRPPELVSSRHDTRGVPIPPLPATGSADEEDSSGG